MWCGQIGLKRNRGVNKYRIAIIFCVLLFVSITKVEMPAYAMQEGKVSISPDGKAFTTNPGEKDLPYYEKGYTIETGMKTTLRALKNGEHFYAAQRRGQVPVKKWEVMWEKGTCWHNIYPAGNMYHGVNFGRKRCYKEYASGWLGYCADCDELIVNNFLYMNDDVAKTIKSLNMDMSYYYKCPHCENLEQAYALGVHICKGISPNRYFVRYHANSGNGYMEKSIHMVNNATTYEGREVVPQATLNLNTYTRKGYEFAGWNTKRDGSGKSFTDGAGIYNLTMEENASVILYAQWKKSRSKLEIDPGGGTYKGRKELHSVMGNYEDSYRIETEELSAPVGETVHFDTKGGEKIKDVVSGRSFQEWSCELPFEGNLKDGVYQFLGKDGTVDRIKAVYKAQPIELPKAQRSGYSFGGWYSDAECKMPVGTTGDLYMPTKETTLYAGWVDLQLVSKDNYAANQGKGAVNLTWSQKDAKGKVYEVFQKAEEKDWIKIDDRKAEITDLETSVTLEFSGREGVYTVPYTGFYVLKLYGAQGQDFEEQAGGKGGMVQATVYLKKGEKLKYLLGGKDGYGGGGTAIRYGGGGGFSKVFFENGEILMVAGGGGGASKLEKGEPGGSTRSVTTTEHGEMGEAGGGGGYLGGTAGRVQKHYHTEECNHVHIGSSEVRGGCYTAPAVCNSKDISFQVTHTVFYYGNISDEGKHQYCVRCASYECLGHLNKYGKYICNTCDAQYDEEIKRCSAVTAYDLSCERDTNYVCGWEDGEVTESKPAFGGSSYVNEKLCMDYSMESGKRTGNGILEICALQVGMLEEQSMNGVPATDLAAPAKIAETTIQKTAVGEKELRISFKRPTDNGTNYYHQVKSFDIETGEFMCESNITKNLLTSQVAGYHYVVDQSENTTVTTKNKLYATQTQMPFLVVEVEEKIRYLHIAPVDKAGNLGETTHIRIGEDELIYWPLVTEKLKISEESNVATAAEPDTYYVKADGTTPIHLTLEGLLCGVARKGYQINQGSFCFLESEEARQEAELSINVPGRETVQAGTFTYPGEQLLKKQIGNIGITDASYTVAKRFQHCRSLEIQQKFVVAEENDGRRIRVMPKVTALGEEENISSKPEKDVLNSIYLIGDAKGPVLSGVEQLERLKQVQPDELKTMELRFQAADDGSGLAHFCVEVRNQDNGMVVTFGDEALSGNIRFVMDPEEPLFQGRFHILITARDRVGNESMLQSELLGMGLRAYVERMLEPVNEKFKNGESGRLCISTWGYVEKLEISFPDTFVSQNATLNRTIVYEVPEYRKNEEILFMVPLREPEGVKTILVKAYKGGRLVETEPEMVTFQVKGSVLDELRTRLR